MMNRKTAILTILWVIVFSLSWASEAIRFECPILVEALREAKGFTGDGMRAIFPEDVSGIEELDGNGRGMTSLEGIEYLSNLQDLYIDQNQISDLTPLQNLTHLQTLTFSNNQVGDLTPLGRLTNLQVLIFKNNEVKDL